MNPLDLLASSIFKLETFFEGKIDSTMRVVHEAALPFCLYQVIMTIQHTSLLDCIEYGYITERVTREYLSSAVQLGKIQRFYLIQEHSGVRLTSGAVFNLITGGALLLDELLNALVTTGYDLNSVRERRDSNEQWTALHQFSYKLDSDKIELLVKHGVDVNFACLQYKTALNVVAKRVCSIKSHNRANEGNEHQMNNAEKIISTLLAAEVDDKHKAEVRRILQKKYTLQSSDWK